LSAFRLIALKQSIRYQSKSALYFHLSSTIEE
jgi:hypothetical protein